MLRVFIPGARRECQRINYTRRRTGNRLLDTGSTPVYSIEKSAVNAALFLLETINKYKKFVNEKKKPSDEKCGIIF